MRRVDLIHGTSKHAAPTDNQSAQQDARKAPKGMEDWFMVPLLRTGLTGRLVWCLGLERSQ